MNFDLNKRYCHFFREISDIPRGSRNEKAISDYVCRFAESLGLPWKQDEVFNVIVDKPASAGYENSRPLILQAHMDMVCEKNSDADHDFKKDPIELYVEDGWLRARGTTLGADDGVGVAYMLAILESSSIAHPPLECIFTVQEEIGLRGALHLKPDDLHGHRYISLDGGGVCVTDTSCAGAITARIDQPVSRIPCNMQEYELIVKGLKGGHSGNLIHTERGNANVIAGRILKEAQLAGVSLTLTDLRGGQKENAIPREAVFRFVSDTDPSLISRSVETTSKNLANELAFSDKDITIVLQKTGIASECFEQSLSDRLIDYLFLMPNGMIHRSMAIKDLPTASLNLGVIYVEDSTVTFLIMVRAADDSARHDICNKLHVLAQLLNLEHVIPQGYPGWTYTPNSELRTIMKNVVERHGMTYKEIATHGGLECGVIKGLDPAMDIITFGAVTEDIHSPNERLNLKSFDDGWDVLCDILKACR